MKFQNHIFIAKMKTYWSELGNRTKIPIRRPIPTKGCPLFSQTRGEKTTYDTQLLQSQKRTTGLRSCNLTDVQRAKHTSKYMSNTYQCTLLVHTSVRRSLCHQRRDPKSAWKMSQQTSVMQTQHKRSLVLEGPA